MRKRIMAVAAMLAMGAGMAMAAQQQGKMKKQGKMGRATVEQQVARMKASLNLTEQQTTQVKELLQKHEQEMQAWRTSNPNPTTEQKKAHRQEMMRSMNESLKKILTPEQYKKHEEMMRHRMGHKPKGPPKP